MVPLIKIHNEIATYYRMDLDTMFVRTRIREIIEKRQLFHYLAKKLNVKYHKVTLAFIAKYGGNMNHATVLNSIKTVENLIATEPQFAREVEEIIAACKKHEIATSEDLLPKEFEVLKYGINEELLKCKSKLEIEAVLRRGIELLTPQNVA
jgi:hypothetical protein